MRAVLFDHDGVLADSEAAYFQVTRQAFARAGLTLRPAVWARLFLGQGLRTAEVAAVLGLAPDRSAAVVARRNQDFEQRLAAGIDLLPGARETIEALRGRVRLVIVTGCPRSQLDAIHRNTGLLGHFETIVTGDDCAHAKPHPEAYLTALHRLGLTAADCLAVEDSPRGLAAARAAGLRCALVPTELTDLTLCPGADHVLDNLRQLIPLVA